MIKAGKQTKNKRIRVIYSVLLILLVFLTFAAGTLVKVVAKEKATIDIPEYTGASSVALNDNIPVFDKSDITTFSSESYGDLDEYGRCTIAYACIGTDLMPTKERESISMVKPSGWNQEKYPGIVDSDPPYLFNRCHMIGFQLTGENANEKNLITGTRYMNVEGMLPYENQVAEYVKSTDNHVMYRVTPIFEGNNLLCDGVQIEALSVEDNGSGICFNVFCYNVQPGIIIDYADGSNRLEDENAQTTPEQQPSEQSSYIGNRNSHVFHYPYCGSVLDMKEKNKIYFGDMQRDEIIDSGYRPCKRCNP